MSLKKYLIQLDRPLKSTFGVYDLIYCAIDETQTDPMANYAPSIIIGNTDTNIIVSVNKNNILSMIADTDPLDANIASYVATFAVDTLGYLDLT